MNLWCTLDTTVIPLHCLIGVDRHILQLFFAFQIPSPENSVAIYSFREYTGKAKGGWTGESNIVGCGPTIRTHKRHYAQQAEYTYCRKKENDKWYYSGHEQAFEANTRDQDVIEKFVLPSCIRKEVLAELDAMNINAYTLYGSEEGLAEMLANRKYAYESYYAVTRTHFSFAALTTNTPVTAGVGLRVPDQRSHSSSVKRGVYKEQ